MEATKPASGGTGTILGRPSPLVWACLGVLAVTRLAYSAFSAPLPDEAYYWLWGQHLALSYYDHPPLQAWMQAASTALFGNTLFGLRAPALLTTLWTILLLAWWARRASQTGRPADLWTMIAVYFATPLLFVYSMIVFNDHLMIALVGSAAVAFTIVFDRMEREGGVAAGALYAGGLAIGLAALTKYNAALFGLGVAAAIVAVPRLRPLLRSPHLYGAAALAALCMAPVVVWNIGHGGASFRYNFVDRLGLAAPAELAEHLGTFTSVSLAVISPFLAVALARFLMDRREAGWQIGWRPLAIAGFAVSTVICLVLTLVTPVLFYWNVPAYLAFLPYASFYMGNRLRAAHLTVGMLVAVFYAVNYAALPLSTLFGQADAESAIAYGWDDVAERVQRERVVLGAEFLLASDYRTGAILAFETGDRDVQVLSGRESEFDMWRDDAALAGQTALILTDEWHPLGEEITGHFGSVEPIAELPVVRFGQTLKTYRLYLGRDYRGG